MKYKRLIIAISIIAVIFGGVAISKSLGWWRTTASRQIIKTSESGGGNSGSSDHDEPGDSTDEEHGMDEVSGSTTVAQALGMGIPEDILIEYCIDISNPDALVKDLIVANGQSFGKAKTVLNGYIEVD